MKIHVQQGNEYPLLDQHPNLVHHLYKENKTICFKTAAKIAFTTIKIHVQSMKTDVTQYITHKIQKYM